MRKDKVNSEASIVMLRLGRLLLSKLNVIEYLQFMLNSKFTFCIENMVDIFTQRLA